MLRLKWLLVPAGVLLGLGAGCATPAARQPAPHQGELLTLEQREQIVPASIGVEGRSEEVRLVLVPTYEEPELTPEERAALGEEPELIDWLEFYVPRPSVTRTWSGRGGVRVGAGGVGGHVAGGGVVRRGQSAGGRHTGVAGVGVGVGGGRQAAPATRSGRAVAGVGSDSEVRVGEGGSSRISGHKTRPER